MSPLDEALAQGTISRMDYLLRRMRVVEEEADAIIKATPEANTKRLALAFDQRTDNRPRVPRKYHD